MRVWLIATAFVITGCRGQVSRDPPIHLNPNMDHQEKFLPQSKSPWFKDSRAMRPQVPGTVAVGELADDDHLHRGLSDGRPAATLPREIQLDRRLLQRGRERYDVYCSPCHDRAGTGDGIVVKKGMLQPPRFSDPRLLAMPVGQIYTIVGAGVRNMPPYAAQIPVADRWAISAYVRALQIARTAGKDLVPPDVRSQKGWSR
jgi:mono/diheme cytochrome c family protein